MVHNFQMLTLTFNLQTCIMLHGKGWTIDDGAFEYGVFYQNIVRMFESDLDDEWVKKLLTGGMSKLFPYLQIMLDFILPRQILALPCFAAGTSRKPKKNYTGIEG